MMKLSTWSALKSTFCYLKNHYWRLLGFFLIMVLCWFSLAILIGGACFVAYKFNILQEPLTFLNINGADARSAFLPQLFTLPKFSVFIWLLACPVALAIIFLLSAMYVALIKAAVLDQPIKLNLLRVSCSRDTARLAGFSCLVLLALLIIAALLSPLILIPDDKLLFGILYGILLVIFTLYLIRVRLNLITSAVAINEVTSWRSAYNLSKVQNWAVFRTMLASLALYLTLNFLTGVPGMVAGDETILGIVLNLSIGLFTLPMYVINILPEAFLYKQYREQRALEHTPTAVQPVQA
jgi:hypothetical protein